MKWQPIETAPEEGSFIIFGVDGSETDYSVAWRDSGGFATDVDSEAEPVFALIEPTHWMPLPPPPKMPGYGLAARLRQCMAILLNPR